MMTAVPQGRAQTQAAAIACVPVQQAPLAAPKGGRHISVAGVDGAVELFTAVPAGAIVSAGQPVVVELVAVNGGGTPVTFSFPTTQRYDAVVSDGACNEIWRWSSDQMFGQIVERETIPAHGRTVYRITWDQRDSAGRQVRPGSYEMQVLFFGRGASGGGPVALPPFTFAVR
jgi:hypothetical protein